MHTFLCSTLLILISTISSARTLTVAQDGSGGFDSIRSAIEAAADGDTIKVGPGFYGAGILSINKSVALIGAGAAQTKIISDLAAISILAPGVRLEGFDIQANSSGMSLVTSVIIEQDAILRHNVIRGGHEAILCTGDARPIVNFNVLEGNIGLGLFQNPNAIDARFNWWGTTDPVQIQDRIFDGNDQTGLGTVEFEPWLSTPDEVRTLVLPSRWGQIKRLFR